MSVGIVIAGLLVYGFAAPVGALPQASATRSSLPPAEEHVAAFDDFFLPSLVEIRRGGTVIWDFTGTRSHTATDATGMHLFDSGLVSPGGPSFSYTFPAAGSYAFACTIHVGMGGHIGVPMLVDPAVGSTSD